MSAADYPFIPTDAEDIVSWGEERYGEIVGDAVKPASPVELYIRWLADMFVMERVMTNYAANQNLPSRAVGDNLDGLAELYYLSARPQAQAASCTMRFTISQAQAFAVLVPEGTRVTDAAGVLMWATTDDIYVPIGDTYVDVKAVCQTVGDAGNGYVAGQINSIVDPFAYFLSCENITESDGGSDAADDAEFYDLMRLSMDGYSDAGAEGGYIYLAKQVSTNIADVVATSPDPCVVKIYTLMKDGSFASDEIKEKILAACSAKTVRPLTDNVFAEDPEAVEYNVEFTYYTPEQAGAGASEAQIAQNVEDAVNTYNDWQCKKLGRDINPSYLMGLLMQTGIKRVEMVSPTFTKLQDGGGKVAPQVARLGTVTIINGGYEDE